VRSTTPSQPIALSYACLLLCCLLPLPASCFSATPPPQSPYLTPESVVVSQLKALETGDIESAYRHASPANKEAVGDLESFAEMCCFPPYDLLLNHERADVWMEVVPDEVAHFSFDDDDDDDDDDVDDDGGSRNMTMVKGDVICLLVCIIPGRTSRKPKRTPMWYWWELSKQEGIVGWEEHAGEWMVDGIMPDFEDLDADSEIIFAGGDEDDDDDSEEVIYLDWEL